MGTLTLGSVWVLEKLGLGNSYVAGVILLILILFIIGLGIEEMDKK